MEDKDQILRALGHIEGRLDGIDKRLDTVEKLSHRVSILEQCQSWLKGASAVLATAFVYLFRQTFAR